ncbi:MAG: 2-octaprenyl-6-methoxyphenyl hydroxylase [Pseudomonadota bacterium]|nr:2-octaprenyl-6-methoxyphenyl hydroxylase [Pseudomonadota bacterium]
MTASFPPFDVAIAGGGIVGMSLALSLARAGISVAVIEKTPMPSQLEPMFDGRVSAIAEGSRRILDAAGAWAGMTHEAQPILDIRVSDGNTPFFIHYDHHEVGSAPFGYIVENRFIRHALHRAAEALPNLSIIDNNSIRTFEPDAGGVTLHLGDGRDIRCSLLIGADGKQSSLRRMAGIDTVEWNYRQTAIVCTIHHERPHDGLAQERFLPAGPFAVLPMTGQRSSLVWVEPDERVKLYLELPEEEFVQEIRERVGDYLGEMRAEGPRFAYPLSLMHAQSYIGPRLALIGDAAHAIHPIAGQGVNLGFRDVGVLSELITGRFRLGLDIGSADVLKHYQRWRRFDNVTMLAVTDGLNRLFRTQLMPVRLARELGMWTVGRIPPLKRFFMRHAMGLVGDLPESVKENA